MSLLVQMSRELGLFLQLSERHRVGFTFSRGRVEESGDVHQVAVRVRCQIYRNVTDLASDLQLGHRIIANFSSTHEQYYVDVDLADDWLWKHLVYRPAIGLFVLEATVLDL
jgi:hypothetical protein